MQTKKPDRSSHRRPQKKLTLSTETLRLLTEQQLNVAAGGHDVTGGCTPDCHSQ